MNSCISFFNINILIGQFGYWDFSSSLDQFPAKLAQKYAKLVLCNIQDWTGFIYIGSIWNQDENSWKFRNTCVRLYITHCSGDCQYNAAKNPVCFNMYAFKAQK